MKHIFLKLSAFLDLAERGSAQMNRGLAVVALVLTVAVLFVGARRATEELERHRHAARWPYALMSTDAPDATSAPTQSDNLLGD